MGRQTTVKSLEKGILERPTQGKKIIIAYEALVWQRHPDNLHSANERETRGKIFISTAHTKKVLTDLGKLPSFHVRLPSRRRKESRPPSPVRTSVKQGEVPPMITGSKNLTFTSPKGANILQPYIKVDVHKTCRNTSLQTPVFWSLLQYSCSWQQ
ncbi:hypothetical protein GN956_G24260 [Arapaima gigas]